MKRTLYLAYGSNLSTQQMSQRCPTAEVVGSAVLKNYRLLFKVHATVEPAQGYSVPVLVWELNPSDEAALDIYEGFPKYYRKEYVKIRIGKSYRKAMLYVMNDRPLNCPNIGYFNIIKEAYQSLDFDTAILQKALSESRT